VLLSLFYRAKYLVTVILLEIYNFLSSFHNSKNLWSDSV
jgi:hypothetical protein